MFAYLLPNPKWTKYVLIGLDCIDALIAGINFVLCELQNNMHFPSIFANTASSHRALSLLQNQIITFGKKPGLLARNINALYDPITAIKCLSMNTALLQS